MKKIFVLMILLNAVSGLYSDEEVIPFTHIFGGRGDDFGSCVQQTKDGGYIIAGDTYSFNSDLSDIFLVKTDSSGNEQWHKTYNVDDCYDSGIKVYEIENGGYIIAGISLRQNTGNQKVILIKVNSAGVVLQLKQYDCGADLFNIRIIKTGTEQFVVMSNALSDTGYSHIGLVKINIDSNVLWENELTDKGENYGSEIFPDSDGGYIITGYSSSSGNAFQSIYLLKADDRGNKIWSKTFSIGNSDGGNYVIPAGDGGYMILGTTSSFGNPDSSICLIKTDSEGTEEWIKLYGEEGIEFGLSVMRTDDSGYLLSGWTYSFGNGETADTYLVKTDSTGEELWHKIYGSSGNDYCFDVSGTDDRGYIITGFTDSFNAGNSDVFLIKTDAQGKIEF